MTGVRRDLLASQNFVMIHLDLVDHGLSWEAAAVLHRIDYRSGGGGWWTVTKAQMQADMRISERKLDRALDELRSHGLLRSERASAETSLMRWGVEYATGPAGQNVPQPSGTKRPDAEDETSRSSTKNRKNNNPSSPAGDAAFEKWWSYYPRKVGKIAARKAFDKALKTATLPELGVGLERAVADWSARSTPMEKIPHPSTWLNEGRWTDEYPEAGSAAVENGEDPNAWMHRKE